MHTLHMSLNRLNEDSKPVTHPILFSLNTQSSRRQPFSIIELPSSNEANNLFRHAWDRLNLARGVAYSFRRSKTKSFQFARSIRVTFSFLLVPHKRAQQKP
jgi:hypothetical protein